MKVLVQNVAKSNLYSFKKNAKNAKLCEIFILF